MIKNELNILQDNLRDQKFAHVYLIETNNQKKCIDDLLLIVKNLSCLEEYKDNCTDCNICHLINKKELPNFFIIEPDGKNIKKEQIIELKNKCSIMPIISKNNIYIIKETEKMNTSSANTMLKFIEEPFDNCYGFFITNNKENVINTIKSRCQNLIINYEGSSIKDEFNLSDEEYNEYLNIVKNYLYKLEVEKMDSIMYNKVILNEMFKEKEKLFIIFKIIFEIYNNTLTGKSKNEFEFINGELSILSKKVNLIANIVNSFNYNLNIDLMLDKFVIEMGEING